MENTTSKKQAHQTLLRDTRGLSTVEYVILMAIVVIGAVGTWNKIGTKVKEKLTESHDTIKTMGEKE